VSDPTAATATPAPAPGPRPRYKRKLANYLLDKKLQLRYVVIITLLSGAIAGTLGYMIFDQQRQSTESIENKLEELTDKTDAATITSDYESEDRALVYKMVIAGGALVVILSLFLVVMTHKVAGPLYKTSIYFDRMAEGRLGTVTPLRSGDMLQDFFHNFKDMHDAVRARAVGDVETMEKAMQALRDARNQGDYRGEAHNKLTEELDLLEKHIATRKKQLA
jgi:methyl-accepting chemotaxis protein